MIENRRARSSALGAISMPTTRAAGDAAAMARTSCPEPQPGTSMLPRNGPRWAIHSKSGGAGAPFSHGVSPIRYLSSQFILEYRRRHQIEAIRFDFKSRSRSQEARWDFPLIHQEAEYGVRDSPTPYYGRLAATNDWTRKQIPIAPTTRLASQNDRLRIKTEIAPTAIAIWNIVTLLANPS
jgi:hypothetical protein